MSDIDFNSFGFDDRILRALDETGHTHPTPIQAEAIPLLLEGKDLMAVAQTGTGKTAAFALPAIQLLSEKPIKVGPNEVRALILAPTRELALQIDKNMRIYARHLKMKHVVVFGGTPYRPQIQSMRKGADILVATPGRLIDLLESGHINLAFLELLILDEADRMLDMGFIHDIRKLIEFMPEERQALMFSATMPPKVAELGRSLLTNPVQIEVTPESTPVDRIDQKVMFVDARNKLSLLQKIMKDEPMDRVMVFTKTKWKADRVAKHLEMIGIPSESIHGDKSQAKRQRVLNAFQKGKIHALVATDVAARGIDVSDITHVFNFELPMEAESYVHRIGRTARAGTTGTAIAFCDRTEVGLLKAIQQVMKMDLPVVEDHPFHEDITIKAGKKSGKKSGGRSGGRSGNRNERGNSRNDRNDRGGRRPAADRAAYGESDSGFFDHEAKTEQADRAPRAKAKSKADKPRWSKDRKSQRDEEIARKESSRKSREKQERSERDRHADDLYDDHGTNNWVKDKKRKFDRPERAERAARYERPHREDRFERTDRSERNDRGDRGNRFERGERSDRGDRGDRFERGGRNDRFERGERNDRFEKSDRPRREFKSRDDFKPRGGRGRDFDQTSEGRGDFDRPSRDARKDRDRKNDGRKWDKSKSDGPKQDKRSDKSFGKSFGKKAGAKKATARKSAPRKENSGDKPLFRGRP